MRVVRNCVRRGRSISICATVRANAIASTISPRTHRGRYSFSSTAAIGRCAQRRTFSFLAAGPLAHGIHVALPGYTLAPQMTLGGIVAEVRAALAWLAEHVAEFGGEPGRIYTSGWSAGGHLTAMVMDEPAVKGGLAISGIYDLEPIRLNYLNDKLELDADEVRRLSPLLQVAQSGSR